MNIKSYKSYVDVPVEAKGFYELLRFGEKGEMHLDYISKAWTRLDGHPFNLSIPENQIFMPPRIRFVGHPGYTKTSIEEFMTSVAKAIMNCPYLQQLRVIKVRESLTQPNHHYLFYEVSIGDIVLICGGCNDCSGGGKSGKFKLDMVMTTLSKLYGLDIEEHLIQYEDGHKLIKNLENNIYEYHKD